MTHWSYVVYIIIIIICLFDFFFIRLAHAAKYVSVARRFGNMSIELIVTSNVVFMSFYHHLSKSTRIQLFLWRYRRTCVNVVKKILEKFQIFVHQLKILFKTRLITIYTYKKPNLCRFGKKSFSIIVISLNDISLKWKNGFSAIKNKNSTIFFLNEFVHFLKVLEGWKLFAVES